MLRIEWVGLYEYLALYYTIIVALVTLGLALILLRWVKPLYRDLESLTAAAQRVGDGDLGARAEVGKASLVEPIAGAFNAMTGRVERLLESHRDLEQGVAHELRTPLAQLKFDLELARESGDAAEREARFEAMGRDVADLEELVNELLLLVEPAPGAALRAQGSPRAGAGGRRDPAREGRDARERAPDRPSRRRPSCPRPSPATASSSRAPS